VVIPTVGGNSACRSCRRRRVYDTTEGAKSGEGVQCGDLTRGPHERVAAMRRPVKYQGRFSTAILARMRVIEFMSYAVVSTTARRII
jgi:hypothetical protein